MFILDNNIYRKMSLSNIRTNWLTIVELTTWWIPDFVLYKNEEKRQAWREKFTLFWWIIFSSCLCVFIIGFLPRILCPPENIYTWQDIWNKGTRESWMVAHGVVYDVEDQIKIQDDEEEFLSYLGQDVSFMYIKGDINEKIYEDVLEFNSTKKELFNMQKKDENKCNKIGDEIENKDTGKKIKCQDVKKLTKPVGVLSLNLEELDGDWFIIYDKVYEYSKYIIPGEKEGACIINGTMGIPSTGYCSKNYKSFLSDRCGSVCEKDEECYEEINSLLECEFEEIIDYPLKKVKEEKRMDSLYYDKRLNKMMINKRGRNATEYFENIFEGEDKDQILEFLDHYFIGIIDTRFNIVCKMFDILFFGIVIMIGLILIVKFLTSLFILAKQYPENKDKCVIINMPCYTESKEEIEKTIYAVADMEYSDEDKKLLCVIADGIVTGKGNDKPTCEYVLNSLGRSMNENVKSYEYISLGVGDKRNNRAKVFTGYYTNIEKENKKMPYMVIVKTGNEGETDKPGNRGKRDSQLILLNFLSKIFYKQELNNLECKIYDDIENIVNMQPEIYEFLMCIDADTEPYKDALKQMVYKLCSNKKYIGLCGETKISNKMDSWVTAIQVYEYYINHHLTKAFESLFGNVTCLPGCFSIYRIKSVGRKAKAFIIDKGILMDYSQEKVITLHDKNLLHLGEDRYLTTLITKEFPNYSLKYIQEATCETVVPNTWNILLSQRRRWINSTIHNLAELVFIPGMCGVCCFSMRFIVLMDLISTLFLPATIIYLYYLIYLYASGIEQINIIMIIIFAVVYGVQVLVFSVKREFEYFGWMIIYMIAMPIWNIILPLYSFWKFDDFSWGKTRKLEQIIKVNEIQE